MQIQLGFVAVLFLSDAVCAGSLPVCFTLLLPVPRLPLLAQLCASRQLLPENKLQFETMALYKVS